MTKLSSENLSIQNFHDYLFNEDDNNQSINSINKYLNLFRQRLINYFLYMKSSIYREHIQNQLDNEMELNKTLKSKVNSLENHMKILLEDTINLLKLRTNELGIEELEQPVQLITYANDISNKHKELRTKIVTLEKEINEYDYENEKLNFILQSIQLNGHLTSSNDNIYSTLLANMSRQTQQQENNKQTYSIESSSTEKKTGFVIPKKMKKISDKSNGLQDSLSSNVGTSINNLLSTKQLEPLQVHSVVSTVGQQSKQQSSIIQSVTVKTLLNNSPSSSSSSNTKSSQLSDEIRFIVFYFYQNFIYLFILF